jgi:hypothetical protein
LRKGKGGRLRYKNTKNDKRRMSEIHIDEERSKENRDSEMKLDKNKKHGI